MMNNKKERSPLESGSLNRRQFLRGAAGAVGASAIGLVPANLLAQGITTSNGAFSIGFWDGNGLVPATSLASGDPTLETVELAVDARSAGTAFSSLNVQFYTSVGTVPYSAWVAAPSGCKNVRLSAPVTGQRGLTITPHIGSGPKASSSDVKLRLDAGIGPKLKEGIYVLVPGSPNWSTFPFNPNTPGGSQPYIVLTVSRL